MCSYEQLFIYCLLLYSQFSILSTVFTISYSEKYIHIIAQTDSYYMEIFMNIELEREKLILFTKIGAIVLTSIALLATSLLVYPDSVDTIGESLIHQKELPIYCVDRDKPVISISFDAAWGNT